jgi:hypothetical protein|tara:strand:+ start:786 stop:968 length:183 start_codon:yes stop_codon:yes gene_type:complete
MKKTFKITTYGTATFEYFVEADTEEEAEKLLQEGWFEGTEMMGGLADIHDETIESIVEDE